MKFWNGRIRLTLNQALVLTVLAALLPISLLSLAQGISNRDHNDKLISERLLIGAIATAASERDHIAMTGRLLKIVAMDPDVFTGGAGCEAELRRVMSVQQPIENFARVDENGRVICRAYPAVFSPQFMTKPWWKNALTARKFTLQGPVLTDTTKRYVMIGVLPLFDRAGRSRGSVNARIDLSSITESLHRSKISPDAVAAIVDRSGNILASAGPGELPRVTLASPVQSGQTVQSDSGQKWLYASVPLFGNLTIVYAEPQKSLLDASSEQLRATLFLPLLAILLTTIAVWIGVNHLAVGWLKKLGVLAREIATGRHVPEYERFSEAPTEIAALGSDMNSMSVAIIERNTQLERAAASTRALAREVNHRVKNNLQMVMSLISLQTVQLKDPATRDALDQTRIRIGALALIHRLLYEQGDESEHGRVDMDRLFAELCTQLRSNRGARATIDLSCKSDVGIQPVDQANPIALFTVEAVANAYRHAFPGDGGGCITVRLAKENDHLILTITDDGIGFDPADENQSMGLELMRAFTTQVDGTLSFEAGPLAGVNIVLRYPVS